MNSNLSSNLFGAIEFLRDDLMNKLLQVVEWVFVVISLIFYTSGPLPVILAGGMGEGIKEVSPDPTDYSSLQALFFLNYLVSLFLLLLRWKKAIRFVNKDWTIWVLMLLSVLSIFWTFVPKQTQARSIALIGTTLFGWYLASRYTIREQLKLLGWSFATIVVMSFVFAILAPKYGTMYIGPHTGAWRGIYVHKNILGKMMVMGMMIFTVLAIDAKQRRWVPLTWLLLTSCLLFLSKSSSSIFNTVTLFMLIPIYQTLRLRYDILVPATIALLAIGGGASIWLSENAGFLLTSIGKDATLTGRGDMWPHIIEEIGKQPWLGYGYNGFWNDLDSPGGVIWRAVKWTTPNSHNGLLDLWLELGLVGVAIFAIGFLQTVMRGLAWFRQDRSWSSFWILLYLSYMVLANLTESSLLNRNEIFWVLYVAISLSLATTASTSTQNMQQLPSCN